MTRKKINAIEMTRKIRAEHAKHLAGKTHAEQIAFYRERAKKVEEKLPVLLSKLGGASGDYSQDSHRRLDNRGLDTALKRIREKRVTYRKKK